MALGARNLLTICASSNLKTDLERSRVSTCFVLQYVRIHLPYFTRGGRLNAPDASKLVHIVSLKLQ
jgi:hypothetical protein